MSDGFSTKTRQVVAERDGGHCWACGGRATELHHRRRRRVNGDGQAHKAPNAGSFCGWGNHTGCHGQVHSRPAWAKSMGYIVLPGDDPRGVPIWHYSRGWIVLTEDGGWSPSPDHPTSGPKNHGGS